MIELENALKNINWDIIGISEIRREGYRIEERDWCIFCYVGETQGSRGVGFLIKKHLKTKIIEFVGFSDRVALLNLKTTNDTLSIIQVYAPTERATDQEVETFYQDISRAKEKCFKNVIILGDFNAKIGIQKECHGNLIGKYGSGNRNDRGEKLLEFAYEEDLAIMNTFFKKNINQRWTWMSPDDKTKNEIDYILSNRKDLFTDVDVLKNVKFRSDHRLLRGTLEFVNKKKSRKHFANSNSTLKYEDEQNNYLKLLEQKIKKYLKENSSAQHLYDTLEKAITESLVEAKNRTNKNGNNNKFNMSENVKTLILKRYNLTIKTNKTKGEKKLLSTLHKSISRQLREEYKNYRLKVYEEWLIKTGGLKQAQKSLQNTKTWIPNLTKAGRSTDNREELISIATDYYKELYKSRDREHELLKHLHIQTPESKNVKEFSLKEIITAIRHLSNNKCPGYDRIINEALKIGEKLLAGLLCQLFNNILKEKRVPSQWTKSEIILIYKKGDPSNIDNYRPISLMSCIYKMFAYCLLRRIGPIIDKRQPVEQAGFRPKFSTIDHIHVVTQIIEKYKEFNSNLYVAFVDYKKAFDSISHQSIVEALHYHEIEENYIEIIKNIYENCVSRISLERSGQEFKIGRGVRQGDPLSPKIFIAVLETIFNTSEWKDRGILIKGKMLSHLRFADDIVLFAESTRDLEFMLQALHNHSVKVGLEMNFDKTKIMTNGCKRIIKVEGEPIEFVDDYVYLGKLVSFRDVDKEEIERRIAITWKKFWSLKEILKSNIAIDLKKKVMDTCILPCLTYGCQTWSLSEVNAKRISTCQRAMERSILGIKLKDRERNEDIRKKTGIRDALEHARRMKWKWAGHLARYTDHRWSTLVTQWQGPAYGSRRRGRPNKRWVDGIRAVAGDSWLNVALDRDEWLKLEEAFTRLRDPIL